MIGVALKKIALFIPRQIDGHWLIFQHILESLIEVGDEINLVLAGDAASYKNVKALPDHIKKRVDFREINYRLIDYNQHTQWFGPPPFFARNYIQPVDFGYSMTDCDLWIIAAGARQEFSGPYVSIRPYITYASHVPRPSKSGVRPNAGSLNQLNYFLHLRSAERVLTTDSCTAERLNSYAGVARRRIVTLPLPYRPLPPVKRESSSKSGPLMYFRNDPNDKSWPRVEAILKSLRLNGDFKNDIILCSNNREDGYQLAEYQGGRDRKIQSSPGKKNNHSFDQQQALELDSEGDFIDLGFIGPDELAVRLNQASALLHFCDDGPLPIALIDAGRSNVPVFSTEYPAAKLAAQMGGTSVCFFRSDHLEDVEIARIIATTHEFSRHENSDNLLTQGEAKIEWAKIIMDVLNEIPSKK